MEAREIVSLSLLCLEQRFMLWIFKAVRNYSYPPYICNKMSNIIGWSENILDILRCLGLSEDILLLLWLLWNVSRWPEMRCIDHVGWPVNTSTSGIIDITCTRKNIYTCFITPLIASLFSSLVLSHCQCCLTNIKPNTIGNVWLILEIYSFNS